MDISIKQVNGKKEFSKFIKFQRQLYKGNPFYVPPLDAMECSTFSEKNPMTEQCDYKLWLAYHNNEVIGRIAAIINYRFNHDTNIQQARFTHFDCIRKEEVAHSLFQVAQQWAFSQGMHEIVGPFGFTNLDKHGLLVEGYEELACQSSNYNHSYYKEYVESFGFSKVHDWLEQQVTLPQCKPEKLARLATLIQDKYELTVVDIKSKKELKAIAPEVFDLYNMAYSKLYGVSPLNENQKEAMIKNFIPHVDIDMVSVVADKHHNIVGFGITMLSLSKSLQKADGSLLPFGFYHMMTNKRDNKLLDLLLIGVHPDYQRKGINALVFDKISDGIYERGLTHMETTQSLESNHAVLNLWSSYDTRIHKRARLYRKVLS